MYHTHIHTHAHLVAWCPTPRSFQLGIRFGNMQNILTEKTFQKIAEAEARNMCAWRHATKFSDVLFARTWRMGNSIQPTQICVCVCVSSKIKLTVMMWRQETIETGLRASK